MSKVFIRRADTYNTSDIQSSMISDGFIEAPFMELNTLTRFGHGLSFNTWNGHYSFPCSEIQTMFVSTAFYASSSLNLGIRFSYANFDGVQTKVTLSSSSNNLVAKVYSYNNTLLGTYKSSLSTNNQWHQVQIKCFFSSTNGEIRLRFNGSLTDDYILSSINTRTFNYSHYCNNIGISGTGYTDYIAVWNNVDSGDGWNDWIGDFDIQTFSVIGDTTQKDFSKEFGSLSTTFGFTTNTSSYSYSANTLYFWPVFSSIGGTLENISVEISNSITGKMSVALYDSDGSKANATSQSAPGTLLYQTTEITNPTSGVNTFTWTSTPSIRNGKTYYLALWSNTSFHLKSTPSLITGWNYAYTYGTFLSNMWNKSGELSHGSSTRIYIPAIYGTIIPTNSGCINDYTPDTTSYIYSSTVGASDSYTVEDLHFIQDNSVIIDLEFAVVAKKSDTGTRGVSLSVKSGETTTQILDKEALNTSYNYYRATLSKDPNTSSSWTKPTLQNINVIIGVPV